MNQLLISDVAPGLALPELKFHVTPTRLIAGAFASRDYSRLHHDKNYVADIVGQRDIFANTQFQAALFERYLNDWSGPMGRVARMKFRMTSSVFGGDEVSINGVVEEVFASGKCGAGVTVGLTLSVDSDPRTSCEALYALPFSNGDNPWDRRKSDWLQPA